MNRFRVYDLPQIEFSPTSPQHLRTKIGDLVSSSTTVRAKIEALNNETGEYRIVLQGTLDNQESKFD